MVLLPHLQQPWQEGSYLFLEAYKEGTFWHGSSDLCIFVRIVEIVNDLCQKLLRLVLSCHIRKLDPCG